VTHDPEELLGCTRQVFEFDSVSGWALHRV